MRRCLVALVSFMIFVIEFLLQVLGALVNAIATIPTIFMLCIFRYHNRIQFFTSKTAFLIVEETEET